MRVQTSATAAVVEPYLSLLTRQLAAATEIIEGYADAASDDIKNEAAIRLVGYWFDKPAAPNGFPASGAQDILARWHEPAVAKVG